MFGCLLPPNALVHIQISTAQEKNGILCLENMLPCVMEYRVQSKAPLPVSLKSMCLEDVETRP